MRKVLSLIMLICGLTYLSGCFLPPFLITCDVIIKNNTDHDLYCGVLAYRNSNSSSSQEGKAIYLGVWCHHPVKLTGQETTKCSLEKAIDGKSRWKSLFLYGESFDTLFILIANDVDKIDLWKKLKIQSYHQDLDSLLTYKYALTLDDLSSNSHEVRLEYKGDSL